VENPGLPNALWAKLDDRLWHATSCDAVSGILSDGEIKPAVGDRYTNSFCRGLGCVSLFHFGPSAEDIDGQIRNWTGWFGHQQESRMAVWLEIDRANSAEALIDAGETRALWHDHLSKQIIPGVEACHKGPIPIEKVSGALLVAQDDLELFERCNAVEPEISAAILDFEGRLPPSQTDGFVEALLAAQRRHR
jgi:hypothetical protein